MPKTQAGNRGKRLPLRFALIGAALGASWHYMEPIPEDLKDHAAAEADPESITLREAYGLYPTIVRDDLQVCFNYTAAHNIRARGHSGAVQRIVDMDRAMTGALSGTPARRTTFLSQLPADLKDELLYGMEDYRMDETKATVLRDVFGLTREEQIPPAAMQWIGERLEEYARRIAVDPVLVEMRAKDEWTEGDMQRIAHRILEIQYDVYLSEFGGAESASRPAIYFVTSDELKSNPIYRNISDTTLGVHMFLGPMGDTITIIPDRAGSMSGMLGTIGHEISHSLERRLLERLRDGRMAADHPMHDLVLIWDKANGGNYSSEISQAYVYSPMEFMARIVGQVSSSYTGRNVALRQGADVSGLGAQGSRLSQRLNAQRQHYDGPAGERSCGAVMRDHGLHFTR